MEEGEEPAPIGGDSHDENPIGASEEGEAPGSAKACLRHQDQSVEDSPASQTRRDGVLPDQLACELDESPVSENSVENGATDLEEEGKSSKEIKQGKQARKASRRLKRKTAATKNDQMTKRNSQEEKTNQEEHKTESVDDKTKDGSPNRDKEERVTLPDATADASTDDADATVALRNEEMSDRSGSKSPTSESIATTSATIPKPKQKTSVQAPTLQAALNKNVKMGRDDTGTMMSELLMRLARDHEEKSSRKEVKQGTPGPQGSPVSSTSNVGSPATSSDEAGGRMLLTLLQQQPDVKRNKPQSRGKASPALDDGPRRSSPHQWSPATGSPASVPHGDPPGDPPGDPYLTSVISNVDRSGSFLMQLLTTNQQFSAAREMKGQEERPLLAISSTKSLRGTSAGDVFMEDNSEGQSEGQEDADSQDNDDLGDDESSVLVIQPEPSAEIEEHVFNCPICGARFDNNEDRAFHFQVDHRDLELVDEDSSQQEYIALEELKALATPKPATHTRKRKASHTRKVVENFDLIEEDEHYESPIAKRTSQDNFRPEHLQVASPKLTEDDDDIGFVQGYLCKTCGMLWKSLEELREHKATAHPELLDNTAKRKSPVATEPSQRRTSPMPETKVRNKFRLETCLICGKSSRDVTLKNIYRTGDRYDLTLSRLLERKFQDTAGHSLFICVVCKRQVRKLEMAIKIKRQLQKMFDDTNSSARKREGEPPVTGATPGGRLRRKSSASERGKRRASLKLNSPERGMVSPKAPEPSSLKHDQYSSLPIEVASVFNGLMSDNPPILEEIAPRSSPSSYTNTNMALRSLLAGRVLNSASSSPIPSSVPTILKVPALKKEGFSNLSIKAEPDEDIPALNSSTRCNDDEEGTSDWEDEEEGERAADHSFIPPRGAATPKSATANRRRSKRTPKRVDRYSPTCRNPPEGSDNDAQGSSPCPQPQRSILGEILGLGTVPSPSSSGYAGSSTSGRSQAQGSDKHNSGSALSALIKGEPDSGLSESRVSSLISQAIKRVTTASNIRPSARNPGYVSVPGENPNIQSHQCIMCHMVFFTTEGITAHVSCHVAGSHDFKCFKCGFFNHKLPSQWRIMQGHLLTHRLQPYIFNKFPCTILGCKQLFRSENERVDHIAIAHQGQTSSTLLPSSATALIQQGLTTNRGHGLSPNGLFDYTCPLCNNSLQTIEALDVHVKCHGSSGNYTSRSYQCYLCGYCHPTQPGSWRFMRGHLTKFHVPEPIPNEWFLYYECSRYTCRIKFSSLAARELHEVCHDNTQDGHFRCHWCGYKPYDTPFLWDPMKSHIIKYHPMVFNSFNMECLCGTVFHGYDDLHKHVKDNHF